MSVFAILIFVFPLIVWSYLNRFGNLKSVRTRTRVITFILFATLPLSIYLSWVAYSTLQVSYKDYLSIREGCIIPNDINRIAEYKSTREIECKNGIYNGFTRIYNLQGILIYEGTYLDGKLNGTATSYYDDGKVQRKTTYSNGKEDGTDVYYNENGSTSLYVLNKNGLSRQVYYQIPEQYLDYTPFNLKTQRDYYCGSGPLAVDKDSKYTCLNNLLNGEFTSYDNKGNVTLRVNFINGLRDGIAETFVDGKLYQHLEFKNGILDGKVTYYMPGSSYYLEYEGQYKDGLQIGIFKMYDYHGNITSEVIFDHGQIVKITK